MAESELQALARIQQAHHSRFLGVQDATAELVGEVWDQYANLDDVAASRFAAAAGVVVDAGKLSTSTLSVAYQSANDRLGGFPASGLVPKMPAIRNGIPTPEVYHRSIVEARRRIAEGSTYPDAMKAGRARAVGTARTDVSLSNRAEMTRGGASRPWVVGYRRVLTGKSCAFCATASTQRYKSADLLPLHPICDCDVSEIFGTQDPGQVLNRDLLSEIKSSKTEAGDRPFIVDEDGSIRYAKREKILGPDGEPLRNPDGRPKVQTVGGDKVKPAAVDHGELGKVLVDSKHVPPKPSIPDKAIEVRRTKSTVDDLDVLSEASRKNLSPERVVELREQKAERRFLEDRARREEAKALTSADPEVVSVAKRFGVHPDEVLSARSRVADVRKIAREEAARVQARAASELDRLDTVKLRNPPRTGSKTGTGTSARTGEYDWLEQVSDREKARLSRKWYGGESTPDQFAFEISNKLSRDVSVDEAMKIWLDLNRTEEAAGALRRGKLPSLDAYSGQIDTKDLLPDLEALGYDPAILFGDDLAAAGHIAGADAELVRREALDYLGSAVNATEGPAPYRLSFGSWSGEVSDLERAVKDGYATATDRIRLDELVPQYLDEPGLSFENLYARIVSTARKAGEEVSDYAEIPF